METDLNKADDNSGGSGSRNEALNLRVQDLLPHRYPFLLVDRIVDFKALDYIDALKMVSGLDPYLQGHFPEQPIVPGVIIIEALAQASGILGRLSFPERCNSCLLTELGETRFRRQVVPGDRLDLHVKFIKQRKDFFWFSGMAKVDGDLVATSLFTAKLS